MYTDDSDNKRKTESRSEDITNRGPRGIKFENFIPSKPSITEIPRVLGQFGTLPANLDLSGTGSSTNPQRLEKSNDLVNNYLYSNQKSSLRTKKKPRPPSYDYKRRGENSSSNDDDV